MSVGFTPGPWDAFWERYDNPLAWVDYDDVDQDTAEADAHLIAAAPDLFNALDALLARTLETLSTEPGVTCDAEQHDAAIVDARLALRKARGEVA